MGLEEETMEVGKRTSCLLYFAFCILLIVSDSDYTSSLDASLQPRISDSSRFLNTF